MMMIRMSNLNEDEGVLVLDCGNNGTVLLRRKAGESASAKADECQAKVRKC